MKSMYIVGIVFLLVGEISGQNIKRGQTRRTERANDMIGQAYTENAYYENEAGRQFSFDTESIRNSRGRVTRDMVLDAGIVVQGADGKHYRVDDQGRATGTALEDTYYAAGDPVGIVAEEVSGQINFRVGESAIVQTIKEEEERMLAALRAETDPMKKRELLNELIAFQGVVAGSTVDLDGYQGIFSNIIEAINGGIPVVRRIAYYILIIVTLIMIITVAMRAFVGLEEVPIRRVLIRLGVVVLLATYIDNYEEVNAGVRSFFAKPADLIVANQDDNRDLLQTPEERAAGAANTYMDNPFKAMENYLNGIVLIELELGKYEKMKTADKIVLFFGKIIGMIALVMGCLTLVIAMIEFQIVALYALIVFPLGILDRLKDWGQKAMAALCGCAIKIGMIILLMVLFDASMLGPLEQLIDPQLNASVFQVLSDLVISGVMFGMLITKAPAMAQTLLTGIPSLSAANFTTAAVALGTQMGLGARAVAGGMTHGANTGAAIGGHIAGARNMGISGLGGVMSGLGGAVAHGTRAILNKVGNTTKASFNEGKATQMANAENKQGGKDGA